MNVNQTKAPLKCWNRFHFKDCQQFFELFKDTLVFNLKNWNNEKLQIVVSTIADRIHCMLKVMLEVIEVLDR